MPTSNKKKGPRLAEVVALRPHLKKKEPRRPTKPLLPVEPEAAEKAMLEMVRQLTTSAGTTDVLRAYLQTIFNLLKPKVCYVARFFPEREHLHMLEQRVHAVRPGQHRRDDHHRPRRVRHAVAEVEALKSPRSYEPRDERLQASHDDFARGDDQQEPDEDERGS